MKKSGKKASSLSGKSRYHGVSMKQYQSFIFDTCAFDAAAGTIALGYSLDDELHFTETLRLPTPYPQLPTPSLEAPLRALHLIAGISYFKTCLPKAMEIRSGSLTRQQADFWNTVYEKGLGEFFFRNQIDFHGLINFPAAERSTQQAERIPKSQVLSPKSRLLVPIGGGKDSIVTAELLKRAGHDVTLLRIGRHPYIEEMANVAGMPLLVVDRKLDPQLFALNAQGALNGHVPVTAYLSILSVLLAELYGFDAVVMSNEASASEGNVEYLGGVINHQWSKSVEFERMLRAYLKGIGSGVEYFSLLRPWSELRVVQQFSMMPQYFASTTSCNANWKIANRKIDESPIARRWCGSCPKCAFAFALFAAFLPQATLEEIFGKNLFADPALLPLYRQLLGLEGFKPFECVGTPEETAAAFLLAHQRGDLDDTPAMGLFLAHVLPTIKDGASLVASVLAPSSDHCIPEQFLSLLPSS